MQTFYMMVGLPGSGKSTYAESIPNASVMSSDKLREAMFGDQQCQKFNGLLFDTLHDALLCRMKYGEDVVYDATNIDFRRRMDFLSRVRRIFGDSVKCVCVFMLTPYESCLSMNSGRERKVPDDVIFRMHKNLDIPMYAEGWDEIVFHRPPALDYMEKVKDLATLEHDNPHHTLTVGQHCLATLARLDSDYPNAPEYLRRAAILHDFGKEKTKGFLDSRGNPSESAHFYNHERVGAYDSFFYTGDLSHDDQLRTALLIRWHMYPYTIDHSNNPEKTRSKLERLVGPTVMDEVMILNQCDRAGH